MEDKLCRKCGMLKDRSEFYRNRRRKDGLYSECKICWDAYSKFWRQLPWVRQRDNAAARRRRAADPERARERKRNWRRTSKINEPLCKRTAVRAVIRVMKVYLEASGLKRCAKCGDVKSIEEFHKARVVNSWSKFHPRCKTCRAVESKEYFSREDVKEQRRRYTREAYRRKQNRPVRHYRPRAG